jgi:uncharacterized damage-inducible protein DinB
MTVKDLHRRLAYGYWANAKLLAVVSGLTPEQFTQHVAGSYGSVRNTLVHMLSAEWGWLDRCGGPPPARGAALKADDFPTLESITSKWTIVESNARAFLTTLTDDDLRRVIEFNLPQTGPRSALVGDLLEHAANHGVHHRGQLALLLRGLGRTPGNVDLLFYDAETRGVVA